MDLIRDKMIELLKNSPQLDTLYCTFEEAADYILADGWIRLPCKVGDKVAVRALCECVYTLPIYEECRNECPFEDDCPCEKCDDANERIFVTKVNRIFNDGYGWKFEFNHLGVEASISDFGVSFFVGEDAEQQAKEYEQALAERSDDNGTVY